MLSIIRRKLRHLYSRIVWLLWKRPRSKVVVKRFRKLKCRGHSRIELCNKKSISHSNGLLVKFESGRPIRIAIFNKFTSSRGILKVLREIDADVLALQDVKA
ncbi:hypothetical protein VNO77_14996 [Canavalia gladiata]|uniref:Uncharacterized protein n=1 Tax=Canavalia gladiata TaxID=3824 RepID=A0AAN9LZA0_CANGL